MSIHESIHHFNMGTLIKVSTKNLNVALQVLENKIEFMNEVAKQVSVCAEVKADMRKYEIVKSEIARLLEARETAEIDKVHISKKLLSGRAAWC